MERLDVKRAIFTALAVIMGAVTALTYITNPETAYIQTIFIVAYIVSTSIKSPK